MNLFEIYVKYTECIKLYPIQDWECSEFQIRNGLVDGHNKNITSVYSDVEVKIYLDFFPDPLLSREIYDKLHYNS